MVEVENNHRRQLAVGRQDDWMFCVFRETSMLNPAAYPDNSGRIYKGGQRGQLGCDWNGFFFA